MDDSGSRGLFALMLLASAMLGARVCVVGTELDMYKRVDACQHQGHARAECWALEKGYGR